MRRVRLRWRLAFSHAMLAVVLVAIAGNRIAAQTRVADRARALAVAERDADALAARASRVFNDRPVLDDLVSDEQRASRQAEVLTTDRTRAAGTDLFSTRLGQAASDRVLGEGDPATASDASNVVVAASPVIVGSALVGVALVAEVAPANVPGIASFGVSNWLGLFVVVLAAGAGWILAGVLSRPIARLTDDTRRLALGTAGPSRARVALPEVSTLYAAIEGIAARRGRGEAFAREQREALRALTHRVSHQLRTPLTILRLRVDDLADAALPDDQRVLLAGVVADQIDRLDRLGEDLAALDPARWELTTEPIDLSSLVREVVERNGPLASWGGVSMTLRELGPVAEVCADRGLIEDAIANVVHNAIKYTPRGGRIDVTVSQAGSDAIVVVADSGSGFNAGEREAILHPGVRGRASALAQGTGQGLSLVADAMTRHGGRIELGDRPGGGALVRLVLPVKSPATQ